MLAVHKIKPLGNQVLIKRSGAEKTLGGILLPESVQEKPKKGIVVAIGPGKRKEGKLEPMSLKENDCVLFSSYAGTELEVEGEEYLLISEDEVIGILENN